MEDVYENIHDYNPSKKKKLIVFDEMIANIMTNKKFQAIIKELFIRPVLFSVPKGVRLNSTDYLIMKMNNKKELQLIIL